jgi:hypothetical protein
MDADGRCFRRVPAVSWTLWRYSACCRRTRSVRRAILSAVRSQSMDRMIYLAPERPSSATGGAAEPQHIGTPPCPAGRLQRLDTYPGLRGTGGSLSQRVEIKVLPLSQRGIFRKDAPSNHDADSGAATSYPGCTVGPICRAPRPDARIIHAPTPAWRCRGGPPPLGVYHDPDPRTRRKPHPPQFPRAASRGATVPRGFAGRTCPGFYLSCATSFCTGALSQASRPAQRRRNDRRRFSRSRPGSLVGRNTSIAVSRS